MRKFKDWIEFWESRDKSSGDLRLIDGYVFPMAELSPKAFKELLRIIAKHLELGKEDLFLDVGCGAGLLTSPLSKLVKRTSAIDASPSMISLVKGKIETHVSEAASMPFKDSSFDKILCHSIFQYFPSQGYAKKVILEMLRVCKPSGRIFICDIPDIDKKEEYLKVKGKEEGNLKRTYYSKEFFRKLLHGALIEDHSLSGYRNSKFRFTVTLVKK